VCSTAYTTRNLALIANNLGDFVQLGGMWCHVPSFATIATSGFFNIMQDDHTARRLASDGAKKALK